jgi:hypothetical protein
MTIEIVFGERRIRATQIDQLGGNKQCRFRRGDLGFRDFICAYRLGAV